MKTIQIHILLLLLCSVLATEAQKIDTLYIQGEIIEMVYVKGGSFERGCDFSNKEKSCLEPNQGINIVTLKSYYIAKYETTRALYKKIMGKDPSYPEKLNKNMGVSLQNPVNNVSWYETMIFIDSLNKLTGKHFRLPTEAEWEYAARSKEYRPRYRFAGSNNLDKITWYRYDSSNHWQWPLPVGGKMPNALGLYDITGNVAEWCSDWYSDTYYQEKTKFTNPQGPMQGTEKVYRGGHFGLYPWIQFEVSYREKVTLDAYGNAIGFRLAMDAEK
ncbi:MAG: SUMF1/EgtB/PvdO family nonheme iron enzyme [Bacteroidales bacterium]|nr:SUMF1/EgtB/PvdO family nonheme iron enzyme [Bacteroidales bacterium]